MSTKLWCAVCQTTHSQLWMASDLVLPSTQLTVLERLKGLELQLQTHCILCTACYSLVEHWDKQIDAATKTEEILKGLIPPTQNHLHGGQESVDDAFVREQQKEDAGSPTTFSDSLTLEAVEPSRVGTDGLTDAEVAVADCLVTAFGRSQSETSAQNPAVSNTAQVGPTATAVDEVKLIGSESTDMDGAVPPLALESESVAGAADVDLSVPVLEGPVTQCPVASVNVTDPDVDRGAAEPVTSDGYAADVATSERYTTGLAGPGEVEQSESAPLLPLSDAPESAGARHHCHICGKRFARSGSLNDHLAAHAGTKTYACGECDLRFQYRDGLLVHRRRHHGGGRLACPHCSVHFEKSCNLRRHLRVHTGERPFGCTFCPKRFAQSNGLKKHIRGLHADRVAPKSS